MLKNYLNCKVRIGVSEYAYALLNRSARLFYYDGTITDVDDEFIQLDNNILIAINYITYVEKI